MTAQGTPVSLTVAFEGFIEHDYEIALSALGFGEAPPSSTDQHLFGLLVSRALSAIR